MTVGLKLKVGGKYEHFAHFYESGIFITDMVAKFIADGLRSDMICINAAADGHIHDIESKLARTFPEFEESRASGRYIRVDPVGMLSKIIVNGMPDAERFDEFCGEFIRNAAKDGNGIRMYGEGVNLLWAEGNYDAAIRLEELWNDLGQQFNFSLFCAYPMSSFVYRSKSDDIVAINASPVHAHYEEARDLLSSPDERLRAVCRVHHVAPQGV